MTGSFQQQISSNSSSKKQPRRSRIHVSPDNRYMVLADDSTTGGIDFENPGGHYNLGSKKDRGKCLE